MTSRAGSFVAVLVSAAALTLGSCANTSSGLDTSTFTEQQKAGMKLAESQGCVACHGPKFTGGVGPGFLGLAGSQVELDDGTTVTADDAYLTESIKNPAAKKRKGYSLTMPTNSLSDTDVANLVAFIKALKS